MGASLVVVLGAALMVIGSLGAFTLEQLGGEPGRGWPVLTLVGTSGAGTLIAGVGMALVLLG